MSTTNVTVPLPQPAIDAEPLTHPGYWDCECEENYIHDKCVCKICCCCGCKEDDMPDSRIREVDAGCSFAGCAEHSYKSAWRSEVQTRGFQLTHQEHATILAALRLYQMSGMGDPQCRVPFIQGIATDVDTTTSLDDYGIEVLCLKLNVGLEERRLKE